MNTLLAERGIRTASSTRTMPGTRSQIALVAVVFFFLSTPQFVNAFKLLPVLFTLLIITGHVLAPTAARVFSSRVPLLALGLIGWLFLTALWSDGPLITMVQSVATLSVLLLAALVGSHCSLRVILAGVITGGLAVLALSLALAVVSPATGLMPGGYQGGALRGLYTHRNLLAEVLTPAVIAALAFDFGTRHRILTRLVCLVPLLAGLALTRSSTALGVVAMTLGLAVLFTFLQRFPLGLRMTPLAFAVGGVLAVGAFVVTNPSIVFAALQRDDTLTGRTPIWAAVSKLIGERPVGGHGWGATWDVGAPARVFVERSVHFEVPSAHNGYLDSALQIGVVGLALFLLIAVTVLVSGTRRMLASASTATFWAPIFTLGLLTYNIAEASMVSTLSIFLLLTTLVHFSATRQRSELP